jgi:hypothetical protein
MLEFAAASSNIEETPLAICVKGAEKDCSIGNLRPRLAPAQSVTSAVG